LNGDLGKSMDNLAQYRSLVMEILQEHARLTDRSKNGVESHTIFDQEHDRYMMFRVGWHEHNRVHTPFLYIRFKNNKIWMKNEPIPSLPRASNHSTTDWRNERIFS
jgi:hypothetical protein